MSETLHRLLLRRPLEAAIVCYCWYTLLLLSDVDLFGLDPIAGEPDSSLPSTIEAHVVTLALSLSPRSTGRFEGRVGMRGKGGGGSIASSC